MIRAIFFVLTACCLAVGACGMPEETAAAASVSTDVHVPGVVLEDARLNRDHGEFTLCIVRLHVDGQDLYLEVNTVDDEVPLTTCSLVKKGDSLDIHKRSSQGGKVVYWWYDNFFALTPTL